MKCIIIINEQHSLLEEQNTIINRVADGRPVEILKAPAEGWNLGEMSKIVHGWKNGRELVKIIFVSPVPALLLMAAGAIVADEGHNARSRIIGVAVFHTDNREKTELPGGKIISRVAATGWKLINSVGVPLK